MPTEVLGKEVTQALRQMQQDATQSLTRNVQVDGKTKAVPYPFPSPGDWRDRWIYFLLIDRFNNPDKPPAFRWDESFGLRQGGTFEGVRRQLGYLQRLGAQAVWLSPVLKNSRPPGFAFTYPGYNTQDFLNIDERFASDGTRATAEKELTALVDEAHARGMHVILDIVLNHSGRVFDYVRDGRVVDDFSDPGLVNGIIGGEPPVRWLNGFGFPRPDWQDSLPDPSQLSPDDAVWPVDLQRHVLFRRRGSKVSDAPTARGFAPGDFGVLRQLAVEYDAAPAGQEALRQKYGRYPVLSILIRSYEYLIAKYDFDAFRIDTAKYVEPDMLESFCNAVREFGLSAGKSNFFTFGEIYDDEKTIAHFVGRNGGSGDGFGMDAALDFPLFFKLPAVAKASGAVEGIRQVFLDRKAAEDGRISSHGEAGRFFVSFLDNHDQHERLNAPGTPAEQVSLGVALLFTLQGIPCLYYGTEQGLQGTNDGHGHATLDTNESSREALWGKGPPAFDTAHPLFKEIRAIADVRAAQPALRYGRIYFREVSGNGQDFGHSAGAGGVVAFSRILTDQEVVVVANTSFDKPFDGAVLVDADLSRAGRPMKVGYSNRGTTGPAATPAVRAARVHQPDGRVDATDVAAMAVSLKPMEVQILVPA